MEKGEGLRYATVMHSPSIPYDQNQLVHLYRGPMPHPGATGIWQDSCQGPGGDGERGGGWPIRGLGLYTRIWRRKMGWGRNDHVALYTCMEFLKIKRKVLKKEAGDNQGYR